MRKINENIAYAKSILNKNGITPEVDEYQDYLKIREICGGNNGYVGILTKIRFVDEVIDMDEIESIFNLLKNSKIDVNKLNKLSYKDILDIFYDDITAKVDKSDIELYYKDDQYSYYKVHTHKGILKIGSPAWCLKTKSDWIRYQNVYPEQWVVIDNRYSGRLISPDNNYLEKYSNIKKPWVRYGVSIRNNSDKTVSWTGNDDNNGQVNIKPKSWTFFGVMNTILNLTNGVKKSYFDSFVGCEKVNKSWHRVIDKKRFSKRLRLDVDSFSEDDDVYVTFSNSYSYVPVILVLNNHNFHIFFPIENKKESDTFSSSVKIRNNNIKQIIFDYINKSDDVYFDGIKLKNNIKTIDEIKNKTTKSGKKQFMSQFGKWLIFDRNKDYYLIVNTDVDIIEIPSLTLNVYNYNMENPMAWYLDKETMRPWIPKKSGAVINDYHKEVINYIKSEFLKDKPMDKPIDKPIDKPMDKKVKGFWDFLKRKK